MTIYFICPSCQSCYHVESKDGGRTGPCQKCGAILRIPLTASATNEPQMAELVLDAHTENIHPPQSRSFESSLHQTPDPIGSSRHPELDAKAYTSTLLAERKLHWLGNVMTCPDCAHHVSFSAKQCPHCGAQVNKEYLDRAVQAATVAAIATAKAAQSNSFVQGAIKFVLWIGGFFALLVGIIIFFGEGTDLGKVVARDALKAWRNQGMIHTDGRVYHTPQMKEALTYLTNIPISAFSEPVKIGESVLSVNNTQFESNVYQSVVTVTDKGLMTVHISVIKKSSGVGLIEIAD